MPVLMIDGQEVEVPSGYTVLQACEKIGVEIPRFCYHERLSIAGNCRMCLVEMERSPKPVASCAMPAVEGMVIRTNSDLVRSARQGVMEFLLINHPLDCPICDQGGECDLQDQALFYGRHFSRYTNDKRAVEEKEFGPLIKTAMTRCIHCTRCIRFSTEVAGVEDLGATGRGEDMEVGTYVEKALGSELSGNMIDLCPVGALTSKPYAFAARSWELRKTESIDVMDAVGSHIRVDSRGSEVMRVLPRLNESINEEWISDKTRFAYDGLCRQRLDRPYMRKGRRLVETDWPDVLAAVARRLKRVAPDRWGAIAGDLACCESMFALKDVMDRLGAPHRDCRQDGAFLDPKARVSYRFNTGIVGIEKADLCLLVGCNPRIEAPIINARLRRRFLQGGFTIGRIGRAGDDLTYPCEELGNRPALMTQIAQGSHAFCQSLSEARYPMIIIGTAALARPDGAMILGAARRLAEQFGLVNDHWNGFNVLHTAASRVGGLDIGFTPGRGGFDVSKMLRAAKRGKLDLVYLLGADELDMAPFEKTFVIYQGHHGDAGAESADIVLPGAAYTEKDATYVNTEGRVQQALAAVQPPGEARADWKIIRALAEILGLDTGYDDFSGLRHRMQESVPVWSKEEGTAADPWGPFGKAGRIGVAPFGKALNNFYMTNSIARSSETMAQCVDAFVTPSRIGNGKRG